jgi:hypothetical protein
VLPYVPFNFLFGFTPLPTPLMMLTMLGLTARYMLVTEIARKVFCSPLEHAIARYSPLLIIQAQHPTDLAMASPGWTPIKLSVQESLINSPHSQ